MVKPVKKNVKVRVPVRADIGGAFSDIPNFLKRYNIDYGETLNISLPIFVKVQAEIGRVTDPITIETPDLNEKIVGDLIDLAAQEKHNASQMALKFIRMFSLDSAGLKITITSSGKIPPASGLGTSAAVGVGIVIALSDLYGLAGINAPELDYLVEQSMGIICGKQDQYASFLGGLNYFKFYGPEKSLVDVIDHKNENSKEYKWFLERTLVYYSGQPRSSGVAIAKVEAAIKKDLDLLNRVARVAGEAYRAIMRKDEKGVKKAITRDRENLLVLSSGYYTDLLWQLSKVGEELGFAHRAGGAGAGGCLIFFGDPKKKKELIKKLSVIGGKVVY